MKKYLEIDLAASYGCKHNIVVTEVCKIGEFGVTDVKSCTDCKSHSSYFYDSCDNRTVSLHSSVTTVRLISLEDVFQQFRDVPELSTGGCCDVLMYSDHKVVVMDMTCTRVEYLFSHTTEGNPIVGKRAVAYRQIEDSVRKLRGCVFISRKIDSFDERIAILAVRKKCFALEETADTIVSTNMRSYSKMSDVIKSLSGLRTNMGNGFAFVMQFYPDVFKW